MVSIVSLNLSEHGSESEVRVPSTVPVNSSRVHTSTSRFRSWRHDKSSIANSSLRSLCFIFLSATTTSFASSLAVDAQTGRSSAPLSPSTTMTTDPPLVPAAMTLEEAEHIYRSFLCSTELLVEYGNLLFGGTSRSHDIRRLLFGAGPNDTPPSPADLVYARIQIENSEATARLVAAKSKFPGLQLPDDSLFTQKPSQSQETNTATNPMQLQDGLSSSLLAVAKHLKFPGSIKRVSNLGLTTLLALHGETNAHPSLTRFSATPEDVRAFPIRKSILEHAIHLCIERKKSKITIAIAQEAHDHVLGIRRPTPYNPSPSQKETRRQALGDTLSKNLLSVAKHLTMPVNPKFVSKLGLATLLALHGETNDRPGYTTLSATLDDLQSFPIRTSILEYAIQLCLVRKLPKITSAIACEARDHVLANRRPTPRNPSTSQRNRRQALEDALSESLLWVAKHLRMPVNPELALVSKLSLTTLLALHGDIHDRTYWARLSATLDDLQSFPIRASILEYAIQLCLERKLPKITIFIACEARDHILYDIRQPTPSNHHPAATHLLLR